MPLLQIGVRSCLRAELTIKRFGVQIPAKAEILIKISAPPVPRSQLSYDEYTDRTMSMGIWDSEGEDWSFTLICRGLENEVANTSYPWLPYG